MPARQDKIGWKTPTQYLVFRPNLVSAWEGGSKAHWQAILWRALCDEKDNAHRSGLLAELEQAMQSGEPVMRVWSR